MIKMVRDKVRSNPEFTWYYDHPNADPNRKPGMGWVEEPYIESTKNMEDIAQDLYEGCLSEHKWGGCNLFYVEYLSTRDDGCYRWKLYRGTLT